MNKEFERCYTFLAEMMQREKDFGMKLKREDFWNGLRRRHKDYRHPARVGCIHTMERSKMNK